MQPATERPPQGVAGKKPASPSVWQVRAFAYLFGAFLGLALLKFGNPPIMEKFLTAPNLDLFEIVLGYPWPIAWAYILLTLLACLLIFPLLFRKQPGGLRQFLAALAPGSTLRSLGEGEPQAHATFPTRAARVVVLLPLLWFGWQLLAATRSVDPQLTKLTLGHFAACIACFYFGFLALSEPKNLNRLWIGLFVGFGLVLAIGWEQHFGGLEESRRYFFLYVYPHIKEPPPPEYLKRISSNRIWATLFYPNALAGALLLLLPPLLAVVGSSRRLASDARIFVQAALTVAALACLAWSGSKGGWLLMLLLGLITLFRLPFGKHLKIGLATAILLAGFGGFVWKYSGFFKRGATSVSARFDYWHAALQTALAHPLVGTGPGTFAIPYAKIKRPESEMARLVHNDYLEQASDSGLPGLLFYAACIVGVLGLSFRAVWSGKGPAPNLQPRKDLARPPPQLWLSFAVWLGVFGWSLQSLGEFPLYIPALAWIAFTFMGWLLAQSLNPQNSETKPFDKLPQPKLASGHNK